MTSNNPVPSWMRVDFGAEWRLAVNHYALRHSGLYSNYALRNWELQGADAADGPWTTLRRHDNDHSTELQRSFVAAWPVQSAAPFRFFGVHQHGPNAQLTHHVMGAGTELYGGLATQ